ncbi:unnamed protein product [Arabis nemorensis]|uniref:Uncharacterized protein n=1 Tax=Arabis nemorensis TaxID=586526 RepID=A0A565BJK2_9BRAS|nr:unnamed protein product [Arabis nemorensis]
MDEGVGGEVSSNGSRGKGYVNRDRFEVLKRGGAKLDRESKLYSATMKVAEMKAMELVMKQWRRGKGGDALVEVGDGRLRERVGSQGRRSQANDDDENLILAR